jgi:hypothetical protein
MAAGTGTSFSLAAPETLAGWQSGWLGGLVYEYMFSTPGKETHFPPIVRGLAYHLRCIGHSGIVVR